MLSHSEREECTSAFWSRRVTCQYQPDSGRSNNGSPIDCGNLSPPSSGEATSATNVFRYTPSRRSNERSTACLYTDDRMMPVASKITTVQAVADSNSRSASELALIGRRREQIDAAAH